MTVIDWRVFGGQRPRLSSRLLSNEEAEVAINAKVWNGKLRAFQRSKDIFTAVNAGPIRSVFQYRYGGLSTAWLHWSADVDVVTSPLAIDPNFRLYYTGDGRPKVTDSTLAANVVRTVSVQANAGATTVTMNGQSKGFQIGDSITISYGASTQNTTVASVSQSPGAATFTLGLANALTNTLNVAQTITNNATRFPLGAYDLGVPAPASALEIEPEAQGSGNIISVADIPVANIDSGSMYEHSVTLAVQANNFDTSIQYDPVAFPSETFTVGDLIEIKDTTSGNVQTFLVQNVIVGGNITIEFPPGVFIAGGGYAVGSVVNNISRGASALVETPTNFVALTNATNKSFQGGRGVGADSIQIDVDNIFKVTLSEAVINAYQNTPGSGGQGQFRFTHFVKRESDARILYQEPHTWELKDGFQKTPSSEGEAFKATLVDTPPEAGSRYFVGTMIDKGEKLFGASPATISITTKVRVRRANRVVVTLESTTHGLQVGERIQLDLRPINVAFGATNLDGKSVTITAVSLNFLTCEGQIGGQYDFGGTYQQVFQDDELSPRTYVYTYVATVGGQEMESGPSPPSNIVTAGTSQQVNVTGFVNPTNPALLWDTNFTSMRLYRFQESETGQGEFLFHSQLGLTTTIVNDTKTGDELLEPLSTLGYLPPPETLKGLIELPNGLIAGFDGKELMFPVPFQLHAWPTANRKAVHDRIVSIGAFGTSVGVATEGIPQVFTGLEPESYSPERIELIEPALSKRGSVDMGYGLAYPSERGLVLVSVGRAELVTEDLFTEDEWRQLNPASFVACRFGDRYLCFYDTGGPVPDFTEHSKAGFILDPKAQRGRLVFLDFWASEAWSDPDTGRTYIVQNDVVREFDRGELEYEYTWRSKVIVLPRAQSMAVAKVEAAVYPVEITFLVDIEPGSSKLEPLFSKKVSGADAFRLPTGLYSRWQVELHGAHEIEGVYVASSSQMLRQYAPGL